MTKPYRVITAIKFIQRKTGRRDGYTLELTLECGHKKMDVKKVFGGRRVGSRTRCTKCLDK